MRVDSNTELVIWVGLTCVSVTYRFLKGRPRTFLWSASVIALLLASVEYRYVDHNLGSVVTQLLMGISLGSLLGLLVALFLGFTRSAIPPDALAGIDAAEQLLKTLDSSNFRTYSDVISALEILAILARSLLSSTLRMRSQLGLFRQGLTTIGWDRLERVRDVLETASTDLAFYCMRRATGSESHENAALWSSLAEQSNYYVETVNQSCGVLASKIGHQYVLTTMIVSVAALVAAVVVGVLQIRFGDPT